MSFISEDYKEPTTSNYMRLQDGDNTIRILSESIVGWEIWEESKNDDGSMSRKPLRFKKEDEIPQAKVGIDKFGNPDLKFFWAFVVYNWNDDKVQILELTQATIRKPILSLVRNKKWGDPVEYNIVITRTDNDGRIEYQVTPEPKEDLPKEITEKYKKMNINLEALYDGEDPFVNDKEPEVDIDKAAEEVK